MSDEQWQKPHKPMPTNGMTETLAKAAESISAIIPGPKTFEPAAKPKSAEILEEANRIIHSDRAQAYGSAEDSFYRIAALWSAYLGENIEAHDVAMMMVLLKVSRAKTDTGDDTMIDIAGYAALATRLR